MDSISMSMMTAGTPAHKDKDLDSLSHLFLFLVHCLIHGH